MGIPGLTEALEQSVLAPRPGSGSSSPGKPSEARLQVPQSCALQPWATSIASKREKGFFIVRFILRLTMVRGNSDSRSCSGRASSVFDG